MKLYQAISSYIKLYQAISSSCIVDTSDSPTTRDRIVKLGLLLPTFQELMDKLTAKSCRFQPYCFPFRPSPCGYGSLPLNAIWGIDIQLNQLVRTHGFHGILMPQRWVYSPFSGTVNLVNAFQNRSNIRW